MDTRRMKVTLGDLLRAAKGDTSLEINVIEAPSKAAAGCFNPTTGYWRVMVAEDRFALVISLRPSDEGTRKTAFESRAEVAW